MSRRGRGRSVVIRRRIALLLSVAVAVGIGTALVLPHLDDAVREITLPLRHEDIIRQQAATRTSTPR